MPTKIEWTQETWNPITGCTKVSEGCRNCYAERMARRLAGRFGYPEIPHHFDITRHIETFYKPTRWKKPRMVFVCSMGDLFHEDVEAEHIVSIFEMMASCKQHTFQILTKRPQRIKEVLYGEAGNWYLGGGDYLPNVWLGVTAENQEMADKRIPILLEMNGWTRFVSVEPMLGSVNIRKYLIPGADGLPEEVDYYHDWIDWVICGGETGPNARRTKYKWVWDLGQQCINADVPFFFKKVGDNPDPDLERSQIINIRQWPKGVTP